MKHYIDWYIQLRSKGYGRFYSLMWARYNYARYNLDGTYLKGGKRS